MSVKKYLNNEFSWNMLGLEYPKPSDFYLSVWQKNKSSAILLIVRSMLFITSLGIALSSLILYILNGIGKYWFIYLTHWGLTLVVFATGFATLVSARCFFYGPISAEFNLPWYVKAYWVLYNMGNPIAYLITVFYWTVLYEAGVQEELNPGLDVAVHGLNAVVMFLLLVSSGHSSRLLHIYQPLLFALTYVIFGLIYYLAGGTDTEGNRWVYAVINWANPGSTIVVMVITGVLLVVLHLITVGLAVARDAVAKRLVNPSESVQVEEGVALQQTREQR